MAVCGTSRSFTGTCRQKMSSGTTTTLSALTLGNLLFFSYKIHFGKVKRGKGGREGERKGERGGGERKGGGGGERKGGREGRRPLAYASTAQRGLCLVLCCLWLTALQETLLNSLPAVLGQRDLSLGDPVRAAPCGRSIWTPRVLVAAGAAFSARTAWDFPCCKAPTQLPALRPRWPRGSSQPQRGGRVSRHQSLVQISLFLKKIKAWILQATKIWGT